MSASKSKRECLYDILSVSRNADNDQLKAAYKKQARQWHPDKNINNISEATKRFKQINEAYEILSDKHERAWYDAHRDAILRGIDKNEIETKSNTFDPDYDPFIDLMPYFSPFIFSSFDDTDPNSFYTIYNDLFVRIIELEKLSKKKTPHFGDSTQSHSQMNEFYTFWEIFESRRSFQFVIKYNLNDATNRKMRKLMHKENRTLINAKRKKWEETIMKLVSFIRKRDPRWRNYKISIERAKQEKEQKMREYQREIEQIMREQRVSEQKEERVKMEKEMENEPTEIRELFECIVCNKVFKSQNAFNTHESSKKHKKELHELKVQMSIENEVLFQGLCEDINDYEIALQMEREDIIEQCLNEGSVNDSGTVNESIVISDEEIMALLSEDNIDIEALIDTYPMLDREYILELISKDQITRKGKRQKRKKCKRNMDESGGNGTEEFMTQFKTFKKRGEYGSKGKESVCEESVSEVPKKKKRRRRRKKGGKDGRNQMNFSQNISAGPIKSKCKACNEMFVSTTKLYNHLKSYPQHALKSQH